MIKGELGRRSREEMRIELTIYKGIVEDQHMCVSCT
jgi:hypothetical protein